MILKCSCKHTFQDNRYGAGMRVHNALVAPKNNAPQQYRCSVCLAVREERDGPSAVVKSRKTARQAK